MTESKGHKGSIGFITLGCAKNEVDSEKMAEKLKDSGYEISESVFQSDLVIINTCSFIQSATEQSIDVILDVMDNDALSLRDIPIVVSGCMPSRYGKELRDEFAEISAFVPCADEEDIVDIVDELLRAKANTRLSDTDIESVQSVDASNFIDIPGLDQLNQTDNPYSAYVKISDGCDRWCSYCTIPIIRGRYRSFNFTQIDSDVKKLIASGKKEIVLIAQDTGRWGRDFKDFENGCDTLASLLDTLAKSHRETLFRVMYIQPEGVTDELLDVLKDNDNVCSYLDIPIQHVDKDILKAMNRRGSKDYFEDLVEHIKERVPDVVLRTTVIVGFPGESECQFEELLDFIEEGHFDYVGAFPYSREEKTKAFDLPDQVDDEEKMDRLRRLRDSADAVSASIIAEREGKTCKVLIEGVEEDGQLFGRSISQAPEVDGITFVDAGEPGDVVEARIVDTLFYDMEAEVL